jgi:HD-GYP domain-containing protein (c-di-GMP phosphodiesterase class II)
MFAYSSSDFVSSATTTQTTLAEIMGAFSYALDLTEGQPAGHSLRSCWIGSRIAQAIGLSAEDRRTVYYTVMLKDLGCSSNAARIAELYLTDDRSFKRDFKLVNEGLGPVLKFVFAKTGAGWPLGKRAKAIATILRNGPEIARSLIETRCTQGADIARRLRFPEAVAQGIAALDEHWDGGGKPLGLHGDEIPLAARVALLAQVAEVFFTNAGPSTAIAEIARHRGGWFDPALCDAFRTISADPAFWADVASSDLPARILALEPEQGRIAVDEDYLDDIATAFGQVIDAKSPYTGGHSERVGYYCDAVAAEVGIAPDARRRLRRAAILHDVGKLAVSSAVLEKPGKLDDAEWEIMRSHAGHTAEILGRIGPMRDMAMIAAAHHERLDGRGYPLGLDGAMISNESRIITVCDFYDALTADRPYRAAMSVDKALGIMAPECGRAIDDGCFAALKTVVTNGRAIIPLPVISPVLS